MTSNSSETSDAERNENAVLTATLENAAFTANSKKQTHQERNYTLKDVEDLLARRQLGPETEDGILSSRPDTPNSDYQCKPMPSLRTKFNQIATKDNKEKQTSTDAQHQTQTDNNNQNSDKLEQLHEQVKSHLKRRTTASCDTVQVSLSEQQLHLHGPWKPHFRKFIKKLKDDGNYRVFDDTEYFISDDPFDDVMKLTQLPQIPLRTRTPSSSTSQDTRSSSFGMYQGTKYTHNDILVPTKYTEDSDEKSAKRGLMKRVKDTIFKRQKATQQDTTDQAALSTLGLQDNDQILIEEDRDSQSTANNSDYETDSDTDTDATMYKTQLDGTYDEWEQHKRVMERVTCKDESQEIYTDAHAIYLEQAEGVMEKLSSLTDLIKLETDRNEASMHPDHTLNRMQTEFNVLNLINPMEQAVDQQEENSLQAHLFTMTSAQIRDLKQKTHPTRLSKFNTAAEQLTAVRNSLLQFSLQISTITEKAKKSKHLQEKVNEVALAVKQLVTEESKLEDLLKTLSNSTYNNHQIPLPTKYGHIDKLRLNDFNNLTKFLPNSKNKLSHVWKSVLERGRLVGKRSKSNDDDDDDCLSAEAWKNALSQHLLGESLDVYYHYQHLSLPEILEKLHHRFERIPSRWELQKELENFKKDPKDSLSCTIEKLRLLLSKLYTDKPNKEKEILIKRNVRDNIVNQNWLPKDIIRTILREEDDARSTCEHFDFEIRAKDMDYWSTQTEGDLYQIHEEVGTGLHAMATNRTGGHSLNKPYGGNVSKPRANRSASPTTAPPTNTPPTTRLPSGGLRHGREGQPSVHIGKPPNHGTAYDNRRSPNKFGRDKRDRSTASPYKEYNEATRRHPQTDGSYASQYREARRPSPDYIDQMRGQSQNTDFSGIRFQPQKTNYDNTYQTPPNQTQPYHRQWNNSYNRDYSYRQNEPYRSNNYGQNQNRGRQNTNSYYPNNSARNKVFKHETEFTADPAVVISQKFTIDEACKKVQCRHKTIHAFTNCPLNTPARDFPVRR